MSPPPPHNDPLQLPPSSPSRLVSAFHQREAIIGTAPVEEEQGGLPAGADAAAATAEAEAATATIMETKLLRSKSTPFQQHRRLRTTSFGVGPTPTRNPSMTVHRRRTASGAGHVAKSISDVQLLPRLEEENANLPPQDSIDFILAQVERQNAMLDEDPKSVCIQSNELKAHLSTMQSLVSDSSEDIDWEFWTALTEDFGELATKLPHLLSAKLKAGIPSKVRGVIWQAMSQSASLNLETVYGQLVAEHTPYERIIQRDLARTFPNVDMFKQEGGDGQQALERVLKAYSLYDSHVGYCQGLAFLVGPLLMNMPEQQAFCVFVRLMETYDMRTMFTLNMEGLQLRLYQFSSLLSQILPELSDHLANHAVHSPMYASQWFLTLFAYAFPIHMVMRIYDIIFAEGAAETIMRVAIALLKRSEEQLLELSEFEDILDYVTSKLHIVYDDDAGMMITDAMELSGLITREKMDDLSELYLREVEQEQKQTEQVLAVRFNFWSKNPDRKKKRESAGWLSKRSSSSDESTTTTATSPLSTSATSATTATSGSVATSPSIHDTQTLHQQIEDLLLALSQIQNEHIQLKQEFVQVRMDKMDVEAERDALKITVQGLHEQPGMEELRANLAKAKALNFELQQDNEELRHQNLMAKEAQTGLIEKMVNMKNKMEQLELEQHKRQQLEREAAAAAAAKPRSLLSKPPSLRAATANSKKGCGIPASDDAKKALVMETRCHELEQMLADAKLHIAELETFGPTVSTSNRRASSVIGSTTPGPSPMPKLIKRRSEDPSKASKRASFYGRFWPSVSTTSQETPPASPI